MIYLRQNGRDKTPSGGYKFVNNVFYGAPTAVLLKDTNTTFASNILAGSGPETLMARGDAASQFTETMTRRSGLGTGILPVADTIFSNTVGVNPGRIATIHGANLRAFPSIMPIVEVDGVPVMVKQASEKTLAFFMPGDWNGPAQPRMDIRIFNGQQWSAPKAATMLWSSSILVSGISPNPAKIGDTMTLTGVNLAQPGTRVLLNNKPASILTSAPDKLTFALPEGILTPTHYNVLVQRGAGEEAVSTWPVTLAVDVPREQMPHLTDAVFSPVTLHVGDLLKVTFTVRNNLPTPAPLMTTPKPPFTYEEKQSFGDTGGQEMPNTIHLRVTSDHPGPHNPGSWPYLFGFDMPRLAPGETTTVTGYIKVETPGVHEFRVGLVATGFRFIDDNLFRTKITVLP